MDLKCFDRGYFHSVSSVSINKTSFIFRATSMYSVLMYDIDYWYLLIWFTMSFHLSDTTWNVFLHLCDAKRHSGWPTLNTRLKRTKKRPRIKADVVTLHAAHAVKTSLSVSLWHLLKKNFIFMFDNLVMTTFCQT